MIRRHVDLDMVRAKLEGRGSREAYTSAEFFRDLLLLCCNAIVFYPKSSPESIAAVHLRGLVTKEMARTIRKLARPPKAGGPIPPAQPFPPPAVSKLKSDPDSASKAREKQTSLVPLTACRKRSSLSGKAAAAAGWKEGKEEKENHRVDRKEWEVEEDETPAKKRTKERSAVSGPRGLRSNKTPGNAGSKGNRVSKSPNSISSPTLNSTAVENSTEATAKPEKKIGGGEAVSASMKKGAAEFLIRMKRSSPTSSGTLRNTLRSSASSAAGGGGGGKGPEQQKKGRRGDGRKDRHSRQSPGSAASKRAAENSAPVKRSVGRPPKRAAAPPPPPAKKAKVELGRTQPPSRTRLRK